LDCADLNLIDWSSYNLLAAALGCRLYIWNADTGDISQLLELEEPQHICSVKWAKDSNYLAVGTSLGEIQVISIGQGPEAIHIVSKLDNSLLSSVFKKFKVLCLKLSEIGRCRK